MLQAKDEDRFWSFVRVGDGCWIWTGSRLGGDYGGFWLNGRMHAANRVSWEIANGPVPEGLQVHHNCPDGDNPACVRPAHLWLGTQTDNMQDKVAKGRHRYVQPPLPVRLCGERQWQAKLTEDDVRTVRARAATGEVHASIAATFGLSRSAISKIVKRQAWAHVP